MSMLPSDVLASLGSLLQGLQSPDNVIRTKAEESLNVEWVETRPNVLLMGLIEQIHQGADVATRGFAAVLFRKIASRSAKETDDEVSKELFMTLLEPEQKAICSRLLECLAQEGTANVRGKIADSVAEVARQYILEERIWSELLEALFTMSHSAVPEHRETSFRIFATTPDIIQKQHEDMVLRVFQEGFKDDSIPVRLSAMEAFASFFTSLNKKAQKKYFKLVGDILSILPPVKNADDPEYLTRALVALVELAEIAPNMFKDHFNDLVTFSIGVVQDKDIEDQARQNALELMCTFAESNAAMCRKDASYTTQMVTQCLSLMTDVGVDDDDATEWNAEEDLETDESDLNHVVGEQCMDRLANRLGGATLLQPTFQWLPQMMSSTAWRDRHAALMAISAISEGCHDMMVGELDKVLDLVIPALQDSHPRVRWAGCNALGQMSTDFANTMQENYHQRVLPAIIPVLNSKEYRVQAHAAASLVNFCEEAEKEVLEPYLDQLLENLLGLLQSSKRFVQEQALSTIATVADSAENSFEKYYSTLMPLLFNVLRSVQEKEMRLLKAKAMECATLIGLAVGKEKMSQDAVELVKVLYDIQESITEEDDPQANYILHCWGRMCRVLGKDFLPYLQGVVPPLLKQAAVKADVQVMDDEEEASQLKGDDEWDILQIKGKFISVKTAALDDKQTALDLITIYAQHLEESFDQYVDQIMDEIALSSLTFFFHDAVRCSAAKLIPSLLSARIKAQGQEAPATQQLWNKVIEKTLESLGNEPSTETLAELYQCFYESVEAMGKSSLTAEHMQSFINTSEQNLGSYLERVGKRLEEAQEKEEGEEEDEDMLFAIEDDQTLLSDMNKAFHTIMKQHGAAFLPHWSRLMAYYDQFITSNDPTQRQWALCIFDDLLEFCGPDSFEYQSHILEPLVNGVKDQAPANRQAAAYGAGVAAQKGGPAWSDFSAGILPSLFDATRHPQARLEDHIYATDNACAAIAKILHFNSGKVTNVQEYVTAWVDTLPITHDDEAAPYAYSFLAQLIEQQHPAVTSRAAVVLDAVCQALAAETLNGNTATRVATATKALIQSTGVDAGEVFRMLPPESQQVVSSYF